MKLDFDSLNPEARRIILVASDAKYKELTDKLDPIKVIRLAASLLMPVGLVGAFFGAAAGSAYLATTWAAMDDLERQKQAAGTSSFTKRLLSKGEIPIPHLSPDEAARRFRFDFGDPEDGAAYIENPCAPQYYLRPAVVNERLAQEKLAAFIKLASALGAKRIAILSADASRATGTSSGSAPLPKAAAQIGLGARFEENNLAERQVFMEFGEPVTPPHVPADLARWLEVEPVLRSLAETRMTGRPKLARAVLQFDETVDVGADITAELARRGIRVGGEYRRVARSSWSFEIEYFV